MPRWELLRFAKVSALLFLVAACCGLFLLALGWLLIRSKTISRQQRIACIGAMLLSLWGLNLLLVTGTYYIWWRGGTAWGGHIRNGHYFLGRGSRQLVEVSRRSYWISWYHCLLTFVGPVVVIAAAWLRRVLARTNSG